MHGCQQRWDGAQWTGGWIVRVSGSVGLVGDLEVAVVIAMIAVRMVEVAVHEVVDVVSVGDGFVAATGAVDVGGRVGAAVVAGSAGFRIDRRDLEGVLIHMVSVRAVEMAVVDVIDMVVVHDGSVSAAFSVDVGMGLVDVVSGTHLVK